MAIKYLDSKRIRGSSTAGGFTNGLGSAADGTNHGTTPASATSAIYGATSLDMDGTDDYVSIPNTSLGVATSWSISCWIYPDTNASEAFMGIWSGTSANKVFGIEKQPSQLNFTVTVGSTNYNISGQNPATTQSKWNHLVFVKDGSTLRAYVDNVATPTASVNSGSASTSPDQRFTIGDRWESSNGSFSPFEGKFQEVAFWNRAITTSEINEIFNGYDQDSATASDNTGKKISETLATTQLGVLGYWSLDSITPTNSAGLVDEKAILGAKADLAKTFDFTSATGWVTYDHQTVGTGGVTIDSSTDNRIEGASAPMEHHDRVVYDLGQAVSDTAWTLDFDFNYSAIATHRAWIPCSLSSIADVNNSTLDDNSMGIQINDNSGTTYFQSKVLKTGATLDETGTQTLSTNTTYYARVQRTSATEMKIQLYANASHRTAGTPTSHSTTITQSDHAGVTDLRYIVVGVAGLGNNPETTSFWVDNIKLVATAKNDSFDLPENTLFVETDTYKYHWLQDNEWKASGSAEFLVSPETYADSSNWTNPYGLTQDYASIDTTNKRVNFAFTTSNSVNSGKVFKLPHALSEKWILQYQLNLSALNGNDYYHIALCENDGLLASGGQGQSLHINTQGASYNRWTMGYRVMGEGTVNKEEAFSNSTWTANTEYYCTLTRGADSDKPWRIDFTVRTGSHTGSVVGTAQIEQGTSTTNGQHRSGRLRNESFKYLQHTSKGNGGSEEMVGYVRNVYLKDGATTI